MRRYFFHLENGSVLEDQEGVELPDLEAAKCAAVQFLAEILCDQPSRLLATEAYQVTCADEHGLMLFKVQMVVTLAPAAH